MGKPRKRLIVVRFRKSRNLWEVDCRAIPVGWSPKRPTFATEEEAHGYAEDVLKQVGAGVVLTEDRDLTLAEYVKDRWLPAQQHELESQTYSNYRQLLDRYVLPALGPLQLREIRARHVRAFRTRLRAEGYSRNTVRLIKSVLSSALTDAVEDELIDVNPCLFLSKKKGKRAAALIKADEKINPLDWSQLRAFLAEAGHPKHRPYGALFAAMALTGLRPGEARALQPGDLDLRNGLIRVERAVTLRGREKTPKDYETRKVDMSDGLRLILEPHLAWLKECTLERGWGEATWLFPSEANTVLDHGNVAKAFHRILRKAGLPHFRPYDLRHTYGSLLLSIGVPLLYVSRQMGHAKPTTTLKHYGKYIPTGDRRWADILTRGLQGEFQQDLEPEFGTKKSGAVESPDFIGEPWRSRTSNLLIKSQLLCQLS